MANHTGAAEVATFQGSKAMAESANTLCYSALQSIKELGLHPTPNAYEVFYTYHQGNNPSLNAFIDNARQRGQLDAD